MSHWGPHLLLGAYLATSVCLMVYGLHCYVMIYLFVRRQKRCRGQVKDDVQRYNEGRPDDAYPRVTIQLPIYNEGRVVERLIRSAVAVEYPADRLEVQVLDDSTDDTREFVDATVAALRAEGVRVPVQVLRRVARKDFKAGALAAASASAHGEFLAIFDADFLIPARFLKRTIAVFDGRPEVACVQTRWGHTNREENWLTRAQSVGIDGHFTAEQGARSYNNLCMNFNGTAGVWRKEAIAAAGGWQGDTLTEDLDLSYRVQLNGYRIRFDFDTECPAELPNNVLALKSQQRRWAKGSIETARKLMPEILRSPRLAWHQKIEAFLHLTHYAVALLMVILCLLTLPVLLWSPMPVHGWAVLTFWIVIIVSAMAPCVMYTACGYVLDRPMFSLSQFPSMVVAGTGLCLNNARAVVEALLGRKTEFVRTPKSGSTDALHLSSSYAADANMLLGVLEVLLGLYCVGTLVFYFFARKYLFGTFMGAYGAGLLTFGVLTLRERLGGGAARGQPAA